MSGNSLFVGIDISKFKHDVAIMDENKQPVCKPFIIGENRNGFQFLIDRLDQLKRKRLTTRFYIGMEATADYWKNLYHYIKEQQDWIVVVINPVRTKAFAKTELRRAKTDPVNAKDIALYLVEKRPDASTCRPILFDNIKDLDTQIQQLKKKQTMSMNKLRIELGKVAPEIEQHIKTIRGKQILALLERFPTAQAIAKTPIDQLCLVQYGKQKWNLPYDFACKMKVLAQNSIAHKTGPGAGLVVQSLIRSIIHDQTEIQILNEQLEQLYNNVNDHDSILTSIKGISKQTAIVLEAYFGDVNRFQNAKQFVAFFGMNPTVSQSGTKKRAAYLEKKGPGVVRHKIFMAILNMIRRKQEPFYCYYQRLVDAGKPKLVAIGAAMRKLLVIMFTMLKNNEKFSPKK